MKKIFTLTAAILMAMGIQAQTETYKPIVLDGENILLAPEFQAIVDESNNATNVVDGKSIATISTTNMTLEAVGGATIADKVDPENPTVNMGQDLVPGALIDEETHTYEIASVGSWNPIQWKNGNNKLDINDAAGTKLYFVMGTGNPYVKMFCEEVYTDGEPTGKFRAQYEYYKPGGQTMPLVGLYYKFTPKVDGKLRIQVWANKGNRNTYVIDDETKEAVPLRAEGYVNGKRANYDTPALDPETGEPKLDNQGNPIYEQYQIFYNAEQIDSIHNDYIYSSYYNMLKANEDALAAGEPAKYTDEQLAAKKAECDEMAVTRKHVLATGNQAFWGWITFEVKAGRSYWLFQDSSQVGFGGYEFSTGGGETTEENDLTKILEQYAHTSGDVVVNLEPGKEYTMSGPIAQPALTIAGVEGGQTKVKLSAGAYFTPLTNLTLKNLDIDASALNTTPLIQMSETPSGAQGNDYYLVNDLNISNCNISNVPQILKDNDTKWCIVNMLIDNCVVSLNSSATKTVIDMSKNGFVKDLTIQNSTFYSKGVDQDYFVRYSNAGRCDRAGFETNSINYISNTFYNVAKTGQWGNYSGFAGRSTSLWTMTKNIFVDCGNGQVARRFLGGRANQSTATFEYNTYWFNGAAEDTGEYDNSSTILTSDPNFKDAANADFTPQGAEQLANKTGDPRWLNTEGISTMVMNEEDVNAPVYNLAGQRVSPTTKGILIKNGKKYINK